MDINDPMFLTDEVLNSLGQSASRFDYGPGPNESLADAARQSGFIRRDLEAGIGHSQISFGSQAAAGGLYDVAAPSAAPALAVDEDALIDRLADKILARLADKL